MTDKKLEAEKRLQRLKEKIIPSIFQELEGATEETKIKGINVISSDTGEDHWASNTLFVEIRLVHGDQSESVEKLVVKYPPLDENFRKIMKSDMMYENESVLYTSAFPAYINFMTERAMKLGKANAPAFCKNLVPPCYMAEFDPNKPEDAVVVLKDLRMWDYKMSSQRTNMDLDHVKLALTQLGRYHAISYSYKLDNRSGFDQLVSKIKNTKFYEENRNDIGVDFMVAMRRPIKWLLKQDNIEEQKRRRLKTMDQIFKDAFGVLMYVVSPKALSVLCHGDYCGNNIFFHYNKKDKPDHAIIYDFQTPFHSSPAIDLSFFLYVNTSKSFRDEHFDEVFGLYHQTLIETMTEILGRRIDEPLFSLENFKKDFAEHAVYGFAICSFFLPVMITIHEEPFDLEEHINKKRAMTYEEQIEYLGNKGGERATKLLVELFEELNERGYFDDLIKKFG